MEELTLMIEKFVGNSPPARSLSEMRELHSATMAGAGSATIVVSMDDGGGKIKPFFLNRGEV